MTELREATARDREAILALRRRCFPDDDREKQEPDFWDWEFRDGRMFIAEDDGRAVAHLGFVPHDIRFRSGETLASMLAVDAMTDPDYRRQHLFSRVGAYARDVLRQTQNLSTAFQIRESVLPAMTRNGWNPALSTPVLVRPLSIGSSAPRVLGSSGEADLEHVFSIASAFLREHAHHPRTAAWLRWRFVASPHWKYSIDVNDEAYVIARRTTLRGYDTLAIADIGWRDVREAKLLLREVLGRGRAAGIRLAAALLNLSHPALPLLVRSGFLPSPHRFRYLVNRFERELPRARWALTWADTDHL
ncbi:MAG TPA: GNAT family N-acetyltransferase [Thermoanaerobaculia bacterium]